LIRFVRIPARQIFAGKMPIAEWRIIIRFVPVILDFPAIHWLFVKSEWGVFFIYFNDSLFETPLVSTASHALKTPSARLRRAASKENAWMFALQLAEAIRVVELLTVSQSATVCLDIQAIHWRLVQSNTKFFKYSKRKPLKKILPFQTRISRSLQRCLWNKSRL
jgi:hypothetical protein